VHRIVQVSRFAAESILAFVVTNRLDLASSLVEFPFFPQQGDFDVTFYSQEPFVPQRFLEQQVSS
jgi:hypothetical protein